MKQFQDVHAQVIGVQETRSKASGHFVVGSFHVLSSPATSRGHGGAQIWIQQTWQTSMATWTFMRGICELSIHPLVG
jgi:exonuclease III